MGAQRDIDVVLRGGWVSDGTSGPLYRADVLVGGGRIVDVGLFPAAQAATVIDCTGRYLMPGFIDAHSHADSAVFTAEAQLALLRQGVTTVVAGQDGVSYAPGDGRYATRYFGPLNGTHPTYQGGGVAALLASYDRTTPVNVAYLVPHGTVRQEVLGSTERAADEHEIKQMIRLIEVGLEEGAAGFSTGLDYAPGRFADTAELIELCKPVAAVSALYVSHLRGYEGRATVGVDEMRAIGVGSGAAVHASHYHGPADLLIELVDDARADGIDMTFDAYPYRRGFTLLGMFMLPPSMLVLDAAEVARQLADPVARAALVRDHGPSIAESPSLGDGWPARATFGYVGSAEFAWAEGLTLAEAAGRDGSDPIDFGFRIMAASELAVSAVMELPPGRSVDELRALIRHEAHMVGSDGIYIGGHPHPRAWGTFARLLGRHTREWGDLSWAQAASHLAGHPARRYGLADRGLIRRGQAADIAVVDPRTVGDNATYAEPRTPASGVDDVLVNGEVVLRDGALTGVKAGMGLRRG
jgi:N-acyl-D-amino-acid deacylase